MNLYKWTTESNVVIIDDPTPTRDPDPKVKHPYLHVAAIMAAASVAHVTEPVTPPPPSPSLRRNRSDDASSERIAAAAAKRERKAAKRRGDR